MSLFLGVHDAGAPMSEDEMKTSWANYKTACTNHGCSPLRAHINTDQGRAYCVTEATSADDVKAAHEEAKVPLNEVLEVKILE